MTNDPKERSSKEISKTKMLTFKEKIKITKKAQNETSFNFRSPFSLITSPVLLVLSC